MRLRALQLLMPVMAGLIVGGCAGSGAKNEGSANQGQANKSSGERQVDSKDAAARFADLGSAYLRQGRYPEAKEILDRALQYDANNFEANWVMGSLLEQIEKPLEAQRYYKVALRLQPGNPELANTYAAYLCKSGKVDEAVPLFDSLVRNKLYRTPWAAATNAAVCLRADKRNADALAYIDRALIMKKDYVEAVIEKADLQLALGRAAGARQTVDEYLATPRPKDSDPNRPNLLLIGVRAALAEGDRATAENNYARQLRRDFPTSSQAATLPQLLQGTK